MQRWICRKKSQIPRATTAPSTCTPKPASDRASRSCGADVLIAVFAPFHWFYSHSILATYAICQYCRSIKRHKAAQFTSFTSSVHCNGSQVSIPAPSAWHQSLSSFYEVTNFVWKIVSLNIFSLKVALNFNAENLYISRCRSLKNIG